MEHEIISQATDIIRSLSSATGMIPDAGRPKLLSDLPAKTPHLTWGLLPENAPERDINHCQLTTPVRVVCWRWADNVPKVRGIYITGPAGVGKTTLAVALANAWNKAHHIFRSDGFHHATQEDRLRFFAPDLSAGKIVFHDYVKAFDWFTLTRALKTLPEHRTPEQQQLVFDIEQPNPSLLWVVDDFAGSSMSEHVRESTEAFIRVLYNRGIPVIITSNVQLDRTTDLWNDQVRSRLLEMCDQINLTGPDMRTAV